MLRVECDNCGESCDQSYFFVVDPGSELDDYTETKRHFCGAQCLVDFYE